MLSAILVLLAIFFHFIAGAIAWRIIGRLVNEGDGYDVLRSLTIVIGYISLALVCIFIVIDLVWEFILLIRKLVSYIAGE